MLVPIHILPDLSSQNDVTDIPGNPSRNVKKLRGSEPRLDGRNNNKVKKDIINKVCRVIVLNLFYDMLAKIQKNEIIIKIFHVNNLTYPYYLHETGINKPIKPIIMKYHLLKSFALSALVMLGASAFAQETSITNSPTADTFVRKGNTSDNSGKTSMEIYTFNDDSKNLDFVGLMSFTVPEEILDADNYEVKSATLRLVTKRVKGDRKINIYNFDGNFAESAIYADVETQLAAARATEPVLQFAAAGQGNKDFEIDKVDADYRTAEAWTNNIDLTEYVKKLAATTFSLVLSADANSNNQKLFFTKEATDFTNEKDADNGAFTIKAEEIVPQLTVVYAKTENGSSGINTVTTLATGDTEEAIYNMQGMRVTRPLGKGLYIINGKKMVISK